MRDINSDCNLHIKSHRRQHRGLACSLIQQYTTPTKCGPHKPGHRGHQKRCCLTSGELAEKRKKRVREIHRPARDWVAINRLWCRSLLFPACRLHNTCISRLHILGHVRVHRRFLIVYFTFRPQASAVWKIAVHSNSAQKKHGAINPISKQTQHMPHPEEKEKGPLISIKTSNKNLDPIPEKNSNQNKNKNSTPKPTVSCSCILTYWEAKYAKTHKQEQQQQQHRRLVTHTGLEKLYVGQTRP